VFGGQSHPHVSGLTVPPLHWTGGQPPSHTPLTHSSPSAQRLPQLPQWRSLLCRLTQLPPQQVCAERQRLPQLPQWRSLLCRFTHLSLHWVCPSGHAAQATPGTEAKAAPKSVPPINLSALALETVPLAIALASSSKEVAIEEPLEDSGLEEEWNSWLMWCSCCCGSGIGSALILALMAVP
jgi:hypothetical protein